MADGKPPNQPVNEVRKLGTSNAKIKEIRRMLQSNAEAIYEQYIITALEAREAGEFDTAKDIFQWLLDHVPADPDTGERIVDSSVDKGVAKDRGQGPRIQIGVAIGQNPTKALPKITVVESDDDD